MLLTEERDGRVDRRRTDTRDRIVKAAMRLFAQKGYSATTIAEIEGAVGLRSGSGGLYRHFPSKESLLLAAIEEYATRVTSLRCRMAGERRARRHGPDHVGSSSRVGRGSAGGFDGSRGVREDLRDLVAKLGEFLSDEQPMVQATADAWSLPDSVRSAIGDAWDDGYAMAGDIFEEHGLPPEEALILGIAAIGSLNHYVSHLGYWRSEPLGVPLARYLDQWVEMWASISERQRLL